MKFFALVGIALLCATAFANSEGGSGDARPTEFVALDPLVVNLRDEHYIQFKPQIKVNSIKDLDLVKAYVPVIRFELIKSLIGKDAAEVGTTAFISAFSKAAAALINETLHDAYVKDVFFDSWLIQ